MGTKVQFKSHTPMHNAIGYKNEHSSNSWPWLYQDNVLSGHLYDGSSLRESNGYSLCDKEMLKQTMLEHEATFTKQVSELHRLYKIQKDLMNELKNGENLKLCSKFQSHVFSEGSEMFQRMPHLSSINSHATTAKAMELPLKLLKERGSIHFQIPIETSDSSIEGNLSVPKATNLSKKKFDLRLPAEAYIAIYNDTITEEPNEPLKHNAEGDNNVKLSLRSEADGSINGSLRLCDLNEPLKLSSYEEGEVLTFVEDNGSTMEHEEIMRHQLHSDIFLGNWDKVDCFQGRSSSTNLSGEIRCNANGSLAGLCSEEFSVISQPGNNKPEIYDKFLLPGQSKSYKSMGEMPSPGTETSEGTSKLPNLNSSEFDASQMPPLFANLSRSVNSSISVPSISYSINLNGAKHTRTSGQLLPSFDFYAASTHSEKSSEKICSEGLLCASVKQSVEPYGLRKNPAQSNSADIEQSFSQLKDELPLSLNMDLDGLCDTKAEKGVGAPEEESKELDYNLIIADKEGDLQLTDGSHEALIREAADNLVAMSLLTCDGHHSHDLTRSLISTSFGNLHWFADFATSTESNTGISRGTSPHYVDNCLDTFEYMTLKLKDTKENDFFHKLQENHNYDNTSTVLLPPTRSRRCLVRKRRQRRDFQKDILPGLSSLSRHEISEDIQSFEGIMRASGKPGKTGLSRRSRSQKSSNWRARGRRKRRSLALTVTEVKTCLPQKEEENRTTGINTTSILGWGRTTRRCRRARLLPGNLSVSLA